MKFQHINASLGSRRSLVSAYIELKFDEVQDALSATTLERACLYEGEYPLAIAGGTTCHTHGQCFFSRCHLGQSSGKRLGTNIFTEPLVTGPSDLKKVTISFSRECILKGLHLLLGQIRFLWQRWWRNRREVDVLYMQTT